MPTSNADQANAGAAAMEYIVQLREVKKIYLREDRRVEALSGIDLDIREGEFVGIVGPSGSGKSTCAHIIGCLDSATSGSCRIAHLDTAKLNPNSRALLRRELVSFVFQEFQLMPRLTALGNVELPLVYRNVTATDRRRIAIESLRRVGLEHRMHHMPSEMSGGQQQRVSIARAIVTNPKIVVADEPTGALDGGTRDEILSLLKDLNSSSKVTIVVVTHDPEVAAATGRVVRFDNGRIVADEAADRRRPC